MMGELKRKESLVREMQQRLESSEGCKFLFDHIQFVARMFGLYDLRGASITALESKEAEESHSSVRNNTSERIHPQGSISPSLLVVACCKSVVFHIIIDCI